MTKFISIFLLWAFFLTSWVYINISADTSYSDTSGYLAFVFIGFFTFIAFFILSIMIMFHKKSGVTSFGLLADGIILLFAFGYIFITVALIYDYRLQKQLICSFPAPFKVLKGSYRIDRYCGPKPERSSGTLIQTCTYDKDGQWYCY